MTTTATRDRGPAPSPEHRRLAGLRVPAGLPAVLLGLVVLVGVLVRLHSPSVLWLDESLSVAISKRDLPDLLDALKKDGSPPFYYLILHVWMRVFGESDNATRALSTVFSVGTLPIVWCVGRRLGGTRTAWAATALLAVMPFAVRYATETRMYALLQLLSAVAVLLVLRALERPTLVRLVPVSLVCGALALTHYWALFLLAAGALLLLGLALRGQAQGPARRTLLAMVGGGLLFLPWLPDFAFQIKHTGTPWAPAPSYDDIYSTVMAWAGSTGGTSTVLTLALVGLTLLAVLGHTTQPGQRGVVVGLPANRQALGLLAISGGTMFLGITAGIVVGAGYAPRYSSVALVPAVLLASLGLRSLSPRAQTGALALVATVGLLGSVGMPFSTDRTQAGVTATRIAAALQPGDLVVYCPDQLGPAVSRRLPAGTPQLAYPLLVSPEIIDWTDYAQRNERADAPAIAEALDKRTDGAIFVVWASGYRTFGLQCEELNEALRNLRPGSSTLLRRNQHYDESQQVDRYPSVRVQGRPTR